MRAYLQEALNGARLDLCAINPSPDDLRSIAATLVNIAAQIEKEKRNGNGKDLPGGEKVPLRPVQPVLPGGDAIAAKIKAMVN